jgi:hypothetical protein
LTLAVVLFVVPSWVNPAAAAEEWECSLGSGMTYDTEANCKTFCSSGTCSPKSVATSSEDSSSKTSTKEFKSSYPLTNPLTAKSIPEAIGRATQIFIGVAGSLALLAFVWGGLLMLTSSGMQDRVARGKQILVMATIGLAIIFGSYALLKAFFKFFGLS